MLRWLGDLFLWIAVYVVGIAITLALLPFLFCVFMVAELAKKKQPIGVSTWRIMGRWRDGRDHVIVMGHSSLECWTVMPGQLSEYHVTDINRLTMVWIENLVDGAWHRTALVPTDEIRTLWRQARAKARQEQV